MENASCACGFLRDAHYKMPHAFFILLILCPSHDLFVLHYLFVERLDLFNLVIATHEDAGTVVNVLGSDFEKALHLAIDSLATGLKKCQ